MGMSSMKCGEVVGSGGFVSSLCGDNGLNVFSETDYTEPNLSGFFCLGSLLMSGDER